MAVEPNIGAAPACFNRDAGAGIARSIMCVEFGVVSPIIRCRFAPAKERQMDMLYRLPAGLLLLAAVAIAIALAGLGQFWVHRRFRGGDFVAHNEVGRVLIA